MGDNMHMEVQEDEEEDDLDFNPLLRGETPSEASSSLSSENEGPCDDVFKRIRCSLDGKMNTPFSKPEEKIERVSQAYVNEDEKIIMQFDDASGKLIKQLQLPTCIEACNQGISADGGVCIPTMKDMLDVPYHKEKIFEPIVDEVVVDDDDNNDDDAICRRTRARHSLANYTLEELETFLQESDDDDNLHNIDDEEEYHKFLAAVLLEGDGDGQADHGERTFEEDEENDADFEIELEEALESDDEETAGCSTEHKRKQYDVAHVPETRQKKRLKEFSKSKKFSLGQAKASLRPILPYMLNSHRPFPSFTWKMPLPNRFSQCSTSTSGTDLINGFTACQVGQLYCLMHEHVQLLLQVFSLSVLDPSRQQVANDLRKLILDIIERHEKALSGKKVSYPLFCFQFPNLHNSQQVESNQSVSYWTPVIDNPVLSILDLAPLRLAKRYMEDIAETVSRYRQSCLEDGLAKIHLSKEPLFSIPMPPSQDNASSNALGGFITTLTAVSPSSSQLQSGQLQPKKSLAATLVESTLKQSIALVPAGVAKLAQRFFHLFNAALFPHKPHPPATTNRVLFTDAEDGLLAMGIMEHNNDWLEIQQHFLPCKSKHQIFVRQKNRSSSKAPENPIKVVRRMKSSPLTEDEKALIYEGLRIFKHDWLSVWKYFVPHRDPSMLPRQWRVATGTQKSYKKTEAVKEKRRLYEARRRRLKARMPHLQISEKEHETPVNDGDNSDGDMECEDEAYVHEALLDDSEAGNSKSVVHNVHLSCINNNKSQAIRLMHYEGSGNGVPCGSITNDSIVAQLETGNGNELLNTSKSAKDVHSLHQFSQIRYGTSYSISSRHLSSCSILGTSRGHLVEQSYRARKRKGLRVVKLAPDLPPVNLPPSVRVISQSAFKIYHGESLHSNIHSSALKDHALRVSHVAEAGVSVMNHIENTCKLLDYHPSNPDSGGINIACHVKENASESDDQLHPLLFKDPTQFSFNCQNTVPSSNNLRRDSGLPTISSTIDFHPLLQRSENSSDEPALLSSFDGPSSGAETTIVHLINNAQSQCQYEQTNTIDLNIHLSSSLNRQRTNEVCDHQNVELIASTPVERIEKDVQESPFDLRDKELEASRETNLLVQSTSFYSKDGFDLETVPQSHDISFHQCIQNFHEESNPGIVMEQEELSDSEDERENVVFECEDLEDSEEEESCGEPTKIHNKAPGFGGRDDESQAVQDLHPQHQQSSVASVKRGKTIKRALSTSNGLPRAKLTRSMNEIGSTKKDRSSQSSLIALTPTLNHLRKRVAEPKSRLPNLAVGTVASKAVGSRRSKRRHSLN